MAKALSIGLAHPLAIDAPLAGSEKADVVRRGAALGVPLGLTLSCMDPKEAVRGVIHCGTCSKCRERHDAFVEAGIVDETDYIDRSHVGTV
jgi:7-cyano-7-deazaguanine synthase